MAILVFAVLTAPSRSSVREQTPFVARRCTGCPHSSVAAHPGLSLPTTRTSCTSDMTRSELARNSHAHVNAAGIAHAALTLQAPAHLDEAYLAVILFTLEPIAFTRQYINVQIANAPAPFKLTKHASRPLLPQAAQADPRFCPTRTHCICISGYRQRPSCNQFRTRVYRLDVYSHPSQPLALLRRHRRPCDLQHTL